MQIDQVDRHKKIVLQVLLVFTVAGSFVFTVLNWFRGQTLLACVEGLTSLAAVVILFHVRKNPASRRLKQLALLYVLIFFSVMMFAFASHGVSVTIFIWALAIPSIAYLLLGVQTGFWVTTVFLTITAGLYYTKNNADPAISETVAYANVLMCAILIWSLSHTYELTNQKAKSKLRQLAIKDHMTGLYNRSVLAQFYEVKLAESIQNQQLLCLVLFDLDRFKIINDQYGHATGDEVLQQFATLLIGHTGTTGSAFRVGGEEFVLLLPCTEESVARESAELIRSCTEQIMIKGAPELQITVSMGMAVAKSAEQNIEVTLKLADDRMYLAKEMGRNRLVHEG